MRLGIMWVTAAFAAAAAVACGADDASMGGSSDEGNFGGGTGGSGSGPIGAGGSNSGLGGSGGLPPEVEVNADFELPHAGEHYVYVANPETDNVAVIDAATLQIDV